MLDVPGNLSILNNSKWGHTQAITVENKAALLQHLILEEVIVRREDNLQAFRIGTIGPPRSNQGLSNFDEAPVHVPGPSTSDSRSVSNADRVSQTWV